MTGNRNKIRTADLPVFSRSLSAAGGEKRSQNAQPQNEILCSKGIGELPNKQRKEPNGYPCALLAAFFVSPFPV